MTTLAPIASVPSALQSATSAINRAVKATDRDAAVVANSSSVESADTLGALVDSRQQALYASAAAKLFSASDEMMASVLDIRA